jgi:hypothetical protein
LEWTVEQSPVQLAQLVDTSRPGPALEEALVVVAMMSASIDTRPIVAVHGDVVRIFRGQYPGYKACNTVYHDLEHTMDTFLALARLIHGAHVSGRPLDPKSVVLGLVTALMHDIGYIQQEDDDAGTGAKYTYIHVSRGADFMKEHLPGRGLTPEEILVCRNMIRHTDPEANLEQLDDETVDEHIVGNMLGVADLLGQMASRIYLEKLLFLYREFEEAFISEFEDELDLLRKTLTYYEVTRDKIKHELNGVDCFARPHFRDRWEIDHDLYAEAIERNLSYLQRILDDPEQNYLKYLRRRGLADAFVSLKLAANDG